MALPPEPLREVLPQATWVVDAEVTEVVSLGAEQPKPQAEPGATSVPYSVRSQVVKLRVNRVLKGAAVPSQELVVEKPVGAYALKAGNKGPFLIGSGSPHPVILGRYGPDSWALARVEEAVSSGS